MAPPSLTTAAPAARASLRPVAARDEGRTAAAVRRSAASRPGILLDRDGTIIVDHGYVGSVEQVELIDGAAAAIARFNRAGLPVAVVTNQAGVARGYYAVEDVERVHGSIAAQLVREGAHIDRFFSCPYHPDGVVPVFTRTSEDRKPRPGLALAASAALGLDLAASWVIGDRQEDMGLAAEVGASAIFIGPASAAPTGVPSFPSLAEAASFVLERVPA